MCYRCEICLEVSKPKQPMLRHTIVRDRPKTAWNPKPGTETAREVAVCPKCLADLSSWFGQPKHGPLSICDLMVAHAFTREDRLERERRLRAERKAAEREALRQVRGPLFPKLQTLQIGESPKQPTPTQAQPVEVTPARKLGRSVRKS